MILDTFFNESKMFSDDTELNENYVDQIEAIALKESEHPVDACFRLTLENEQNWYNIFNTIAVSEMAFLEAHGNDDAIMYEAVDVKKIANTILKWIQTQFAKLKGAFEAAIKKISDAVNMDKKLVKEYEARKNYITTVSYTTKEGAKVWSAKVEPGEVPAIFDKEIYNAASKFISVESSAGKDKVDELKKEWAETKATVMDQARGKILNSVGDYGNKGCAQKDFTSELSKCLINAEGTKEVKVVDAYEKIKSGVTVKDMQKALNGVKKAFNNMIKEAKKVQKEADRKSEDYSVVVDVCGIKTEVIKSLISIINIGSGAVIRAVGADYSTHRAILRKAVEDSKKTDKDTNKAGKEAKKSAKNESADIICTII